MRHSVDIGNGVGVVDGSDGGAGDHEGDGLVGERVAVGVHQLHGKNVVGSPKVERAAEEQLSVARNDAELIAAAAGSPARRGAAWDGQ